LDGRKKRKSASLMTSPGRNRSQPANHPAKLRAIFVGIIVWEFRDRAQPHAAMAGLFPVVTDMPAARCRRSPKSEPGRFDDEDQRKVRVAGFAIGKYPVTGGQWVAFVSATRRKTPKGPCAYARGGVYADRPAVMRSAAKNVAPPPGDAMTIETYRSAGFGFRVARSEP
jgi:formylglycine-generating enzyme required for sulfatase activity